MKIMQINVWQGRLLRPLLALIQKEAPDIIFAQEIYSYPHTIEMSSPWNYFATLELIKAQNHFDHTYFSAASTFPMFGRELSYGNAILTWHSISHQVTVYTGDGHPTSYTDVATYNGNAGRNFQHIVIDTGHTRLNLINHHGHWVNQPLGDEISHERLQKLAAHIEALEEPVIVCGDFNLSAESPAMQSFRQSVNLRDAVASAQPTTTLSVAHHLGHNIICDYILTSPSLKVTRAEVSDSLVSDHKALIVEIDC